MDGPQSIKRATEDEVIYACAAARSGGAEHGPAGRTPPMTALTRDRTRRATLYRLDDGRLIWIEDAAPPAAGPE